MKSFIYSKYTKFVAFAAFLCVLLMTVYTSVDFVRKANSEKYFFGTEYYETERPAHEILDCIYSYYSGKETDTAALERVLKKYVNIVDYCITLENGNVYENDSDLEKYFTKKYHYIADKSIGKTSDDTLGYDYSEEVQDDKKVYLALNESYVSEQEALLKKAGKRAEKYITAIIALCSAALALFIYLMTVCGRKSGDREIHRLSIDNMYTEFTLAFMMAFCIPIMLGVGFSVTEDIDILYAALIVCGIFGMLFITFAMSAARNIKSGYFLKNSIIARLIIWLFGLSRKLLGKIGILSKSAVCALKTLFASRGAAILAFLLVLYSAAVKITGNPLLLLILVLAGCVFVGVRAKDLKLIRSGVEEIKDGNLSYKITGCRCEDLKAVSEGINEIGSGLSDSIAEKLRAERMKAELITNVSHDLKTPLTSIINYADLLKNMELTPEEAADYVKIIYKKSERLKNLTNDLFDISKVQSGNEKVNFEKLDTALLINQSLGENDSEIQKAGLALCVNTDDNLFIMADGRKMSRVMGNLINNLVKYSMKNTRVFIDAHAEGEKAVIEFKNISAYPIDFDVNEITERFVRGDKSRSEEGNGLGLAIAKGYTEACKGSFRIVTDGDLFKVIIEFCRV